MKISVILSTYNRPEFLNLTLTGYGIQTDSDFDVIVADDGSGSETAEVIERHGNRWPYALHHVRQDDDGYRKSAILNKAINASDADYLIFTDGDCIPKPNLVAVHRRLSRPGRYVTGAIVRLAPPTTRAITPEAIISGRIFNPLWLAFHGGRGNYRRALKPDVYAPEFIGLWLDWIWNAHISYGRFAGGNSSCFRRDALEIDGFNENAVSYGPEDFEFGTRLRNSGIKPTRLRVASTALHLYHDRPYANPEGIQRNRQFIRAARESGARSWR